MTKKLAVGDMVYRRKGYGGDIFVAKIESETKTRFRLSTGQSMMKDGGKQVGTSGWNVIYWYWLSPERLKTYQDTQEREELIGSIRNQDFQKLATVTLRSINNHIEQAFENAKESDETNE